MNQPCRFHSHSTRNVRLATLDTVPILTKENDVSVSDPTWFEKEILQAASKASFICWGKQKEIKWDLGHDTLLRTLVHGFDHR